MLVDILQRISVPLSRDEFAKILFSLIQSGCGRLTERTEIQPYNQLKPILDENYTLTFIKSLKKSNYSPREIASVLAHLYQYSYVSHINHITCITLQPHVIMSVDANGKYLLSYETFHLNEKKPTHNLTFVNNFRFIQEPIQFIEKPCIVDIPQDNLYIQEMEILYSPDRCDQFLAFQLMLADAQKSSSSTLTGGTERNLSMPSTSRQARLAEISKTSRAIFSKAYWCGYYYYGIPGAGLSNYTFTNVA